MINMDGIGKLRHRVKIQNYVESVNTIGEPTRDYNLRQMLTMNEDFVDGSLVVDSTITGGTSEAVATITETDGKDLYILRSSVAEFEAGETLDEDVSGALIESIANTNLEVFAYIRPLSARELDTAMQRYGEVTHQVIMRYRDDITTHTRLEYDSRYFNINGIIDFDEQGTRLKLMCKEAV